ncbi:DnaJ-like protein subfamily C member 2 [Nematocida sp. AWRm80]|nr:DnaJ-like protein subfamily C member 2 [Nematocida sp. AWRm80]
MSIVQYKGAKSLASVEKTAKNKKKSILKDVAELFTKYSVPQIKNWKSLDLYYLMGLDSEMSHTYTERDVKEAFRKQARLLHPDKLSSMNINDEGAAFIALTRASQTLTNPIKKRQYDCIAFDEELPEDRPYDANEFFAVFSKEFERNSVFSIKPYTVSLGNIDTPEAQVVSFYKFWQNFESSRVFDFLCQDEDCQNREMRRQMAAQNKEMLNQKKSEDNLRIRKLVSLSIKHDPRVNKSKTPAEEVVIGADGWKSTEVSLINKLLAQFPTTTRNRSEIIFSSFSRQFPKRSKREFLSKFMKLDMEARKNKK